MKRAVVTVITNKEGSVLLLKRPSDHKFPDQWCFPGGKLDYIHEHQSESAKFFNLDTIGRWETYEEAAVRECLEETGILVRMLQDSNTFAADSEFIVKIYLAKPEDYVVTKEFPNREHVEYMWWDPTTPLPENCGPMTTDISAICTPIF